MKSTNLFLLTLFLSSTFFAATTPLSATDFVQLTKSNWDQFIPKGKEVDAIYGDYVLRNDKIVAIIAKPDPLRNANLTIRNVGGFILDLTSVDQQNDQLGCYFPLGGTFHFHSDKKIAVYVDGDKVKTRDWKQKKTIKILIASSTGPAGEKALVEYSLTDGSRWLEVSHSVEKDGKPIRVGKFKDAIRADRTFSFGGSESKDFFWANDEWFRQCYGVYFGAGTVLRTKDRGIVIEFENTKDSTSRFITPADSLLAAKGLGIEKSGNRTTPVKIITEDPRGKATHGKIVIKNKEQKTVGSARIGSSGTVIFGLPNGTYSADFEILGQPKKTRNFGVLNQREVVLRVKYENPAPVANIKVTDEHGGEIPCKVAFFGKNGTKDPDFGPDSASNPVKNLYYSHDGKIRQDIPPGEYELLISRGPEYDVEFMEFKALPGKVSNVNAVLKRVVKTPGWVSTEYHSHSSPSGDNTSAQLGRVLNLLGEHLEFAPCTEHQRIDSYVPHLDRLQAGKWMSTCTGMELTGNPLPLNHQNVFPLIHKPHTQDGGGPRIDPDPVVQIERIAYWDNKSEKLVQSNHPNLIQMTGDANLDGKADGGFKKMFDFMDVMEVHPPQSIFDKPDALPVKGRRGNAIFNWMQLINHGYRIVGVVNTDAHYNFHGSGWLRNYVKSSTDDAGKIDTMEMVRNSKKGHVVMTTGPFMEVQLSPSMSKGNSKSFGPGDDVLVDSGRISVAIKIQCPNWLDVNRVQIFVNGEAREDLNFTRRKNADDFKNGVVKFEKNVEIKLDGDAHIIVATIGEGLELGRVMGPQFGKSPPCAVANPVFVDVDGNGFKANGSNIGSPFLIEK